MTSAISSNTAKLSALRTHLSSGIERIRRKSIYDFHSVAFVCVCVLSENTFAKISISPKQNEAKANVINHSNYSNVWLFIVVMTQKAFFLHIFGRTRILRSDSCVIHCKHTTERREAARQGETLQQNGMLSFATTKPSWNGHLCPGVDEKRLISWPPRIWGSILSCRNVCERRK